MLHVVGGTYRERCDDPHWDQVYGSGLRAAAATSGVIKGVKLSTYVDDERREDLRIYAATYGIEVAAERTAVTPEFAYRHPLAPPVITPPIQQINRGPDLGVSAPAILRFGMLEGTAVVHGERVVYDPQSRFDPQPFAANGSTATHLAIVTNLTEAIQLARVDGLEEIGKRLLADSNAEVVIVKRGAQGLTVFVREGEKDVAIRALPAYRTSHVWPIGSGDIFSAMFAATWAVDGVDPFAAAEEASKATAYYCATKTLPIPNDPEAVLGASFVALSSRPDHDPIVYLAAPFFTTAQRALVREIRDGLGGQGVRVFSPFHDVGLGEAEDVVPKDIAAINGCHAMFAAVDGSDAGTLFEVGHARCRNIPVVVLAEQATEEELKMLRGTGCELHRDFTTAIYSAAWAAMESSVGSVVVRPETERDHDK